MPEVLRLLLGKVGLELACHRIREAAALPTEPGPMPVHGVGPLDGIAQRDDDLRVRADPLDPRCSLLGPEVRRARLAAQRRSRAGEEPEIRVFVVYDRER